jgi:hypothetical protein
MKKGFLNAVVIVIVGVFLIADFAVADVYMKHKQHSGGFSMMGQKQEATDTIQEVWIRRDKVAQITGEQTVLMLLEEGVIVFVNHKEKTYTEMPMSTDKMMGEMPDRGPEDRAAMENMMKNMMKFDVSVTNTGEKKKINNWNCVKYIQKIGSAMMPMTIESWNTEDIKIDSDLYANFSKAALAQMPGMAQGAEDIVKELKKMKGVTVYSKTTMSMMGQDIVSTSELLEWKEGKAPKGTFDRPVGYKQGKPVGAFGR